jgi:hypothetical protein
MLNLIHALDAYLSNKTAETETALRDEATIQMDDPGDLSVVRLIGSPDPRPNYFAVVAAGGFIGWLQFDRDAGEWLAVTGACMVGRYETKEEAAANIVTAYFG